MDRGSLGSMKSGEWKQHAQIINRKGNNLVYKLGGGLTDLWSPCFILYQYVNNILSYLSNVTLKIVPAWVISKECILFSCIGYHYFKNKTQTHCSGFVAYSQQDFLKGFSWVDFSSVQFSRSVMSNSLQPHGLQDARPPCPSPTPRACSNSCPSHRWRHPTTSSSVIPFSSHFQSFSASGFFPVSLLPLSIFLSIRVFSS